MALIQIDKPEAVELVGGLSNPSKMPCKSYSIPTTACLTGRKLAKIPGSVCEKCYAHERGFYRMPNVKKVLAHRLKSLRHRNWVSAMVTLIGHDPYFRWHDSGDVQGLWHLDLIAKVCHHTPRTRHWLPTKESGIVRRWLTKNRMPSNLTIRISASMADSFRYPKVPGCVGSAVVREGETCPSRQQDHKCRDCRLCWDKRVKLITYKLH